MTMEFVLSNSDYNGMSAALYNAANPFGIPVAAGSINNQRVTFNVPAFNNFALRVADSNTVLRSGIQQLSIGSVDASGDFSVTYLVLRPTSPVISAASLAASMALPIVQGDLTVSTMALATVGGNLRASGTATYRAGILGNIPFNYTYDFSLAPVTAVLSSRLLNVVTINVSVTGAAGGLFGWLVNAIVNWLTIMFQGIIADRIESTVQARVDAEIDNEMSASGVPATAQATLRSVTMSGGNVTVEPFVMLPLSAIGCPAQLSSGSIALRDRGQVRKMHAMRERALKGTPQGEAYILLLRQHAPELVQLLATDAKLLRQVDALIKRGLEDFDELAPEKGVLSKESARAATELLRALAVQKRCSPALRAVIERTLPEIEQFVGRPVRAVLDENSAALRKLMPRG
jgi:hypothetical protein